MTLDSNVYYIENSNRNKCFKPQMDSTVHCTLKTFHCGVPRVKIAKTEDDVTPCI